MSGSPITLAGDRSPWEQQPGESDMQFSRFLVFRDLGPHTDRLRQTLEVLTSTGDKVDYKLLRGVYSEFRWSARASRWDRYMAQADRARMIRLRREAIDEQRRVARDLRVKAIAALQQIPIEDFKPGDIARFLDLSTKIEQSIFAELDQPLQTADAGESTSVVDIAAWTPAERQRRMDQLRRELTKRASRQVSDDEVVA